MSGSPGRGIGGAAKGTSSPDATSVAISVKAMVNAIILILAPSFTGSVGMTSPASHFNPRPFDLDLSHSGEALSIAKRDVPGAGKFEHASRVQGR